MLGGSLDTAEHWMISVEKRVVCTSHNSQTLLTGLAALISIYFVLNLKYQPEAEATLEFIQRFACFSSRGLCMRPKWSNSRQKEIFSIKKTSQ